MFFLNTSVTVLLVVVVVESYLPSITGGWKSTSRIGPLIDEIFAYDGPLGCQPLPGFPQEKQW